MHNVQARTKTAMAKEKNIGAWQLKEEHCIGLLVNWSLKTAYI